MKIRLLLILSVVTVLLGCGTLTGIPSHGGGKRFAIEQELVSGTVRAAVLDLDVSKIVGRRAAIYSASIGDTGTGNLVGGRFSLSALLKGESQHSPVTEEINSFPIFDVTSSDTATTTSGTTTTTTTASGQSQTVINSPSRTITQTHDSGSEMSVGAIYNGIGGYTNSTIIVARDSQFLSTMIQNYMVLKGVNVVSPESAEVDVYISIDVFGTIRSRTDWFVANTEILKAKTSLEMSAIERSTGKVIVPPQVSSYEAEYNENFAFWVGPIATDKSIKKSDGLLVDFSNVITNGTLRNSQAIQPTTVTAETVDKSQKRAIDSYIKLNADKVNKGKE
uniref:Uncharacterized protein n=1 Tax=Candidatus Kentrum sp. UNK TaxID=2126344 RepID=A0A451AKF5_9GAMM|nr:MAG: hypothetical protein BECKUNK1418G_GA0071005_10978 [Candidatus Kentron sp. UNK]VFK68438.1 MAG: hypothetical protein BECKUNK1418H_GA0071006_100243 [Candidatus Kentron sp. UNK]